MSAQLDPEQVLDPERFLAYEQSIRSSRLVPRVLRLLDRPGLEVCDVGGASGVFLDELARRSSHPFTGTVIEVRDEYRDRLVNPDLRFVCASILDGSIPGASFDLVTARHLFHHLVAGTVEQTLELQERTLRELVRIVRPGGHVVFEEEVNRHRPFSRAIYYLSRFANRHRIRIRYFETGRVVVSFMTPREMSGIIGRMSEAGEVDVVEHEYAPRYMGLRWKLTVLMADVGNELYVLSRRSKAGG